MGKSLRILVVVDNRDVAEGLSEILDLAGHEVTRAPNAEGAKDLLERHVFDIAFYNVRHRGKGAVESFLELRQLQPEAETILMTGFTIEQLLAEVVVEGRGSLLHRPLDPASFELALEQAMPRGIVLVLSDIAGISDQIANRLLGEGRGAAVARSEEEALALIDSKPGDQIILDLRTSVVSALSVYLKLMERGYPQPVILVGRPPLAGADTSQLFRDLWVTGVLFKPFDPRKLLAALDRAQPRPETEIFRPPEPAEGGDTEAEMPADAIGADVEEEREPASFGGEGRILIIDDDREMAEGISEMLETRGYEVAIAQSFDEALRSLRGFAADVALIDVQIGGSNGLDLIPILHSERPLLIPIMLTARADTDTVVAALRSGAYDYLTKPLNPTEFIAALDRSFKRLQGSNPNNEPLLAKISHDLRTPLNAVIGFSEILKNQLLGPMGSDRYVDYAKDINTAGLEMTDMLGGIAIPAEKESPEKGAAREPDQKAAFDADTVRPHGFEPIEFPSEALKREAPRTSVIEPENQAEDITNRAPSGRPTSFAIPTEVPRRLKRFSVPSLETLKSEEKSESGAGEGGIFWDG